MAHRRITVAITTKRCRNSITGLDDKTYAKIRRGDRIKSGIYQ